MNLFLAGLNRLLPLLRGESLPRANLLSEGPNRLVVSALLFLHGESLPRRSESSLFLADRNRRLASRRVFSLQV